MPNTSAGTEYFWHTAEDTIDEREVGRQARQAVWLFGRGRLAVHPAQALLLPLALPLEGVAHSPPFFVVFFPPIVLLLLYMYQFFLQTPFVFDKPVTLLCRCISCRAANPPPRYPTTSDQIASGQVLYGMVEKKRT